MVNAGQGRAGGKTLELNCLCLNPDFVPFQPCHLGGTVALTLCPRVDKTRIATHRNGGEVGIKPAIALGQPSPPAQGGV